MELPDGVHFEQYVLRMPKAAMTVLLDDERERVADDLAAQVRADRWTWELPGGYVDPDEDPAVDSIRDRIAQGEIIGAGTQIGLLHLLAFRSH